MKPVRLGELRELLQDAAFAAWWTEWQRAGAAQREARARHDDLRAQAELMTLKSELAQRAGVEAFSRAGEAEDEGTRFGAEAQERENRALGLVGEYEEQRFRTSDLWVRLGGAEKGVEDRREARAKARHDRNRVDTALRDAERQHQLLSEEYAAADRKRAKLWDEVEGAWAASFERSLLAAERGLVARRVRREAERLFEEAEERRTRAKQLGAEAVEAARELREAQARQGALLARARERFGCVAGSAFLYFRHKDDKRSAFAVALADDPEGTNLEVRALAIYLVGRHRGVAVLEPARDGLVPSADEGDRRFEEYFLGPRKGARHDEEGGSSPADPRSR
jgi:chromosome segregation ATPase